MSIQTASDAVAHSITVDLEEWYHVCGAAVPAEALHQSRIVEATQVLLRLLQQFQVRATFFVLGSIAQQHPDLIRAIAAHGHEIASHGWSHQLVTALQPAQFRDELERTASLLEQLSGQRPLGFRAPRWSLSHAVTPWAFEELVRLGYHYDSSLTPLSLIGDPKGSKRPYCISTAAGMLWELPPLVTATMFGNLPTGGGWGFRFFPLRMLVATLYRYQENKQPGVLFVHPRELDPQGPRLSLGWLRSFVTYGSRTSAAQRLSVLMEQFCFKPLYEQVALWQSAS